MNQQFDLFTTLRSAMTVTDSKTSFYKTVPLNAEELKKAEKRANSLQEQVYDLLKKSPKGLTKSDLRLIFGQQFAEPSFGRSLTNLCYQGRAYKDKGNYRKGLDGVKNTVYKAI